MKYGCTNVYNIYVHRKNITFRVHNVYWVCRDVIYVQLLWLLYNMEYQIKSNRSKEEIDFAKLLLPPPNMYHKEILCHCTLKYQLYGNFERFIYRLSLNQPPTESTLIYCLVENIWGYTNETATISKVVYKISAERYRQSYAETNGLTGTWLFNTNVCRCRCHHIKVNQVISSELTSKSYYYNCAVYHLWLYTRIRCHVRSHQRFKDWGPFHQQRFSRNSESMEISPCCNSRAGHQSATRVCACYDSTATTRQLPCHVHNFVVITS